MEREYIYRVLIILLKMQVFVLGILRVGNSLPTKAEPERKGLLTIKVSNSRVTWTRLVTHLMSAPSGESSVTPTRLRYRMVCGISWSREEGELLPPTPVTTFTSWVWVTLCPRPRIFAYWKVLLQIQLFKKLTQLLIQWNFCPVHIT